MTVERVEQLSSLTGSKAADLLVKWESVEPAPWRGDVVEGDALQLRLGALKRLALLARDQDGGKADRLVAEDVRVGRQARRRRADAAA